MSMNTAQAKLSKCLKDLLAGWDHAKWNWRDQKSREFEETYVQPLEQKIRAAIGAMAHISELLAKSRRDCG